MSDMYSLHHEFSPNTTKSDHDDVGEMKEFLSTRCDLMKSGKLSNMITGIELEEETSQYLLNCFVTGEAIYQPFRKERLVDHSKGLFDEIHHVKIHKKKKPENEKKIDLSKIKAQFSRYVEIARTRCCMR